MALIASFTRDRALSRDLSGTLEDRHDVAEANTWHGFRRLVRERPVTVAVVDQAALDSTGKGWDLLGRLERSYPRLGMVFIHRVGVTEAASLFDLGRRRPGGHLVLLGVDHLERGLKRSIARSVEFGATATVTRALSPHVPHGELLAVQRAMDGMHRRWAADDFAGEVGLSRPFLSEVFKGRGLPSVGHLLLWTRLFHAAYWLPEPGRTGESVSRQLEYSSGPAFRRALKHYTGATPTQVVEGGGLDFVLRCFLRACGFPRSGGRPFLTVA